MERYEQSHNTTSTNVSRTRQSRLAKNEELYQDLGKTMKYTTITTEIPTIKLDAAKKNYRTREGYHQVKDFSHFFEEEKPESKKELEEFNSLYDMEENRVYDINSILEQAKKERTLIDEKEKKRKLKNDKYNILATMDQAEIEAIKNRKRVLQDEEEEEMKELIDTITSHNLRDEIDGAKNEENNSLLADLMATSVQDKIDAPIATKIEQHSSLKGISDPRLAQNIDESFYTKSMDLSDKDFDMDDELEEEVKDSKGILILKIFFLLLLMVVVVVGAYYIVKSF